MARKGAFTPISVHTLACGKDGKKDGRKVDPGCPGLSLVSRNDGRWRHYEYRYMMAGKARTLLLGSIDKVTLADARAFVTKAKAKLAKGEDPSPNTTTTVTTKANTFRDDAKAYFDHKRGPWDEAHARLWWQSLENHVLPAIGDRDSASLSTQEVADVVRPAWLATPETGQRILGRIKAVLEHAIDIDDDKRFPAGNVAIRARKRLPDGVRPKPVPHPACPVEKMPALYRQLVAYDAQPALALRFLLLACCPRSDEVTGASWEEISFFPAIDHVWFVPGIRVKSKTDRTVPLPRAAVELLDMLPSRGTEFLFPGRSGRWVKGEFHAFSGHMHDDAMRCFLRDELGLPWHVHGFRASFRSWVTANAQSVRDHDAAEIALDHVIGQKVHRAYDRADLLTERRDLAERWAAYLMG